MGVETENRVQGDGQQQGAEKQEDGDGAQALSRRARVRRLLIEPLTADGLTRPKAATVEAHHAFLDKLADRLAYLDDGLLVTLAEVVLRVAEGPARNVWPSFATIWNHAVNLRRPPEDETHIMTTWLTSVEGPIAREAGYLVELHGWLRKNGYPPNSAMMQRIREEAAANASTRARIARDVQSGTARPTDVDWLNSYLRALAHCEALVDRGNAKRAGVAA